jgi:hypothetical protein
MGPMLAVALLGGTATVCAENRPAPVPVAPALTPAEQAATARMLDRIGALSGQALATEVVQMTASYGALHYDVGAILALVKAGAGLKQGAVTNALQKACDQARVGAADAEETRAYCTGAAVASATEPAASPIQSATIDVAGIQTTSTGGGGAGASGGTTVSASGGNGVGNGTSGTAAAGGTGGTNATFTLASTRSSASSVGSSTTSSGGVGYYVISVR